MAFPSRYTADIAARILDELRSGRSLRAVCRDDAMPAYCTVLQWVTDDREGFAANYRRAREIGNARTGRLSLYTADVADRILHELSNGRTLIDVCRGDGMPAYGTVRDWVTDDRQGFAARYRRALEIGNARTGRPTLYTADIAELILQKLSDGCTLAAICSGPGMPSSGTVRLWATENREGFAARYSRARETGCHDLADQLLEIADDARGDWIVRRRAGGKTELVIDHEHISRCRLRVNARNWLLSRMLPRIFGDRPDPSARHESSDDIAALMKAIDGRTRGLPNAERGGKKDGTE